MTQFDRPSEDIITDPEGPEELPTPETLRDVTEKIFGEDGVKTLIDRRAFSRLRAIRYDDPAAVSRTPKEDRRLSREYLADVIRNFDTYLRTPHPDYIGVIDGRKEYAFTRLPTEETTLASLAEHIQHADVVVHRQKNSREIIATTIANDVSQAFRGTADGSINHARLYELRGDNIERVTLVPKEHGGESRGERPDDPRGKAVWCLPALADASPIHAAASLAETPRAATIARPSDERIANASAEEMQSASYTDGAHNPDAADRAAATIRDEISRVAGPDYWNDVYANSRGETLHDILFGLDGPDEMVIPPTEANIRAATRDMLAVAIENNKQHNGPHNDYTGVRTVGHPPDGVKLADDIRSRVETVRSEDGNTLGIVLSDGSTRHIYGYDRTNGLRVISSGGHNDTLEEDVRRYADRGN